MNSCPVCGKPVSEERPRYRILLAIEGMTRSTKQISSDETATTQYCTERQVCAECWEDLRERLS